jgi:hypothetical protein
VVPVGVVAESEGTRFAVDLESDEIAVGGMISCEGAFEAKFGGIVGCEGDDTTWAGERECPD